MSHIGRIGLPLLLAWSIAVCAAGAADENDVETEIRQVLQAYALAYENKDLDGIMAMVATDPEPVFVDGRARGRHIGADEIRESYASDFAQFQSIQIDFTWVEMNARGNVAWFASEWVADVDTGKGRITVPARWTAVLKKEDGKWLFVQSHFSYTTSLGSSGRSRRPS